MFQLLRPRPSETFVSPLISVITMICYIIIICSDITKGFLPALSKVAGHVFKRLFPRRSGAIYPRPRNFHFL
jgi:hypothetical protein